MTVEDFLTQEEEKEIIEAIRLAEKNTSGEIRVHIEQNTDETPFGRAMEVFEKLEMQKTKKRNGVLFYFAIDIRSFAIYADEGINEVVSKDFWDTIRDEMLTFFKQNQFQKGIVAGIIKTGKQLKAHFPYSATNDINELSDQLSKGKI